jgi:hypothetical protein
MRNKSFGPKKLRLVHSQDLDWFDLLSRANPSELNGSTSGGATHREDLIRVVMADSGMSYEEAARRVALFD